ncbi:arsenate reductase like protein [Spirochaeta thermophila DSM 6578]|uniref:Arsenate reductase like protein n=1 Tax=Winmispira thermophila (strain ATCC 700085 / DSM 6578 / Z-1203) TaxID=869211 RepID=G0GA38_WINT7|nr:arsenate reductase like protein [Spirochaeta thermophila DSM 6578]
MVCIWRCEVNIIVYGTRKCRNTQKAIRFFKERRIPVQFFDLTERPFSPGEARKIAQALGNDVIDTESRLYRERLAFMEVSLEELLLEHPGALRTPVVREGTRITAGYVPEVWSSWFS